VSEHIALLGDSIFDNASYAKGLPDVVTHFRKLLPDGIIASLLAVDRSTTGDLGPQLVRMPPDVSRAVLSVGGNDAILNGGHSGSAGRVHARGIASLWRARFQI
jgi:hypothetical protein